MALTDEEKSKRLAQLQTLAPTSTQVRLFVSRLMERTTQGEETPATAAKTEVQGMLQLKSEGQREAYLAALYVGESDENALKLAREVVPDPVVASAAKGVAPTKV